MKNTKLLLLNVLFVGGIFFGTQATANADTIHTVQKGDTLYGIASKYKTSVDTIKSLSGLKTNSIYLGQKLTVQKTVVNTSTASTVKATSSVKYLQAVRETTIYEASTGKYVATASLLAGQKVELFSDYSSTLYRIKWNDGFAFINKSDVLINTTLDSSEKATLKPTNIYVTPKYSFIYASGKIGNTYTPLAKLYKGQKYEITGSTKDWYIINIGGKAAYVLKDKSDVYVEKKATYLQAKADTPIYDNRTGSLDAFATLLKGQEVKLVSDYSANWYQIKWNGGYAYIVKSAVEANNTLDYTNPTTQKTTTEHIIPKYSYVYVSEYVNGRFVPFASIDINHRYPIIGEDSKGYLVDIGGRTGYVLKDKASIDKGVATILYHFVYKEGEVEKERDYKTITPEQLESEMAYLKQKGYTTITTKEMERFIKGEINLPARSVLISVDDGNKSDYVYAYPIFKKYGIKAANFVITGSVTDTIHPYDNTTIQRISKPEMGLMTDVYEYQSQSHDLHQHIGWPTYATYITTKSEQEVLSDLAASRNFLNGNSSFAYPLGGYNDNTIVLLKKSGFTSAFTAKSGFAKVGSDIYQIPRVASLPGMKIQEFAKLLGE